MSQSIFNIDYWRDHGWYVPPDFILAEDEQEIDYTFQFQLSIPITSPITNKSLALKGELHQEIIKFLKKDLEVEKQEGWFYCLTKINLHMGEILDGPFYSDPCLNIRGVSCETCDKESPEDFDLCWLCGSMLKKTKEVNSFMNVFIEITSSTSCNDLAEWQYDEGPARWAEIEWESIVKEYFVNLCEIPISEFSVIENEVGDVVLTTEAFEISVRFNPRAMIS